MSNVNVQAKISAHYIVPADGKYQVDVQIKHPSTRVSVAYGSNFMHAPCQYFYYYVSGTKDQQFTTGVDLRTGDGIWVMTYLLPKVIQNDAHGLTVHFGADAGDPSELSGGEAAILNVTRKPKVASPNLNTFGQFPFGPLLWDWMLNLDQVGMQQPTNGNEALSINVTKGSLEEEVNIFMVDGNGTIRGFWGLDIHGNLDTHVADYPDGHNSGLYFFALVTAKAVPTPAGFVAEYKFEVGDPEKDGSVKLKTV